MDWSKAKSPETPVIVKTAWCRLTMPSAPSECWVTYHPDFPGNGGEGVYNAYPKKDFHGAEMPQCLLHAQEERDRLDAERKAFLESRKPVCNQGVHGCPWDHPPTPMPKTADGGSMEFAPGNDTGGLFHSPQVKIEFQEPPAPLRLIARHCRTCLGVCMGREDVFQGIHPDAHLVPGTNLPCKEPKFGQTVVVAVVPW